MALQTANNLAQARRSGKLGVKHGHKLTFGRKPADMLIGIVGLDKLIEPGPWNPL